MKFLSRLESFLIVLCVIFFAMILAYGLMPEDTRQQLEELLVWSEATDVSTESITAVGSVVPSVTVEPILVSTPEITPEPTIVPAWDPNVRVKGENSLPVFNNKSSDLIDIIRECKRYYAENGFTYCMCPAKRKIPADQSLRNVCESEPSKGANYHTDCSTYASWVLYEYGKQNNIPAMMETFSTQNGTTRFRQIGREGGGKFFYIVPRLEDAQPGDILVYNGHMEFFAELCDDGVPIVWGCGSEEAIANPDAKKSTYDTSKIKFILRIKEEKNDYSP